MDVGAKIKETRKSRNLTTSELASLSGVAQSAISKIERGLSIPNIDTLEKLVKVLGIELADFFATETRQATADQLIALEDILIQSNQQLTMYEATLPLEKKERFEEKRKRLDDMIRLVLMEELLENKNKHK